MITIRVECAKDGTAFEWSFDEIAEEYPERHELLLSANPYLIGSYEQWMRDIRCPLSQLPRNHFIVVEEELESIPQLDVAPPWYYESGEDFIIVVQRSQ